MGLSVAVFRSRNIPIAVFVRGWRNLLRGGWNLPQEWEGGLTCLRLGQDHHQVLYVILLSVILLF